MVSSGTYVSLSRRAAAVSEDPRKLMAISTERVVLLKPEQCLVDTTPADSECRVQPLLRQSALADNGDSDDGCKNARRPGEQLAGKHVGDLLRVEREGDVDAREMKRNEQLLRERQVLELEGNSADPKAISKLGRTYAARPQTGHVRDGRRQGRGHHALQHGRMRHLTEREGHDGVTWRSRGGCIA